MVNNSKRGNDLTGKEWLQNSFSIWRDLRKSPEEKKMNHPASFPISLCEKVIKTFSKTNSRVLDPFNGIGASMVAASNVGSSGVGIDLSKDYCAIASSRINSDKNITIMEGNNLDVLDCLEDNQFDLCITSPPYWDILNQKRSADKKQSVTYSDNELDLGNISDYEIFIKKLGEIFEKVYHKIKPGGYCIVNVMDLRKKSEFFPLHMDVAIELQKIGFTFDDLIIWDRQSDYNNMRPLGYPYKFRINKVHEYLLIFYKEKN